MSNFPYEVKLIFFSSFIKNMLEKKEIFYQAILMRRSRITLLGLHNYQFYLFKKKYFSKESVSVTDS